MVRILSKVGYQMCEVTANMAPSWAPDAPYWRQDGHLELNLGSLGGILGLSWWILEGTWEVLGRILETFWDGLKVFFFFGFLVFWFFPKPKLKKNLKIRFFLGFSGKTFKKSGFF